MFKKFLNWLTNRRGSASKFEGKSILVVDDGEVERKFIARTLERNQYRVTTAPNGEDGLKEALEGTFDLIILDFYMPGMTGIDVCKRVKTNPATKNTPVIFLTGSATPSDIVECYDVGADFYLKKPIGGGTLLEQVEHVFEDTDAEREVDAVDEENHV